MSLVSKIKKTIVPATPSDLILGSVGVILMATFVIGVSSVTEAGGGTMMFPWLAYSFITLWLIASLGYKLVLFSGSNIRALGWLAVGAFIIAFFASQTLYTPIVPSTQTLFYEIMTGMSFLCFVSIDMILSLT